MITPEDIARLFVPPTETPEQLLAKKNQLEQQIRLLNPSAPGVEALTDDYMLLSAYLSLDDAQFAEVRMQAAILNTDTLDDLLTKSSMGARFIRLGETIITAPSISKYLHAQYSVGVFGLRKPDDAGSLDPQSQNLLLIADGSTSIGIRESNPGRSFTEVLVNRIGKMTNPLFEARAVNED